MDFSITAEQRRLCSELRTFCDKCLRDEGLRERDRRCEFGRTLWDRCAHQGLTGTIIAPEHGGSGMNALTAVMLLETLGEHCEDRGLLFSIAAHLFACAEPLQRFGTETQKRTYLQALAEGTRIATHAISEPSAGSDVFAMSTTAEPRGDGFQLNGIKCFATNAPVADLFLIYAVTAKGRGFFGVSAFLVPRETRGLQVGAPHDKIGLRTSPMADIYLEDCVVPRSALLGELGAGAAIFMHSMNWERASLFALYVGAMQRQLGLSVEYARARRQFGEPISHFQAVSHRIVDMKIRLETARLLLYRAAWALENDPSDNLSPAMAKLYVSEAALRSALDAVHLHGGVGVMEGDVERMLRDAIPAQLFSGTSDIQRNNIARELRL